MLGVWTHRLRRHPMRTIGTKITELTPSSGFCAELTASDTITWSMVPDWARSRSLPGHAPGLCRRSTSAGRTGSCGVARSLT